MSGWLLKIVSVSFAATLCLGLALRWGDFNPSTDEGSVCTMAAGLLEGATLYEDLWNEKTPLQYVVAAMWFHFSEPSLFSLRLLAAASLFVVGVTALSLVGWSHWWVVVALVSLAPWYEAHHALAESNLAILALFSAILTVSKPTTGRAALAGVLVAVGMFFKQNHAVLLFPLLVCGWPLGGAVPVALGFLAASVVQCLALYAHAGDAVFMIPPLGNGQEFFAALSLALVGSWMPIAHALVAAFLLLVARRARADRLTEALAMMSLVSALPVLLRPGFFRLWPALVLALVCAGRLVARSDRSRSFLVAAVLVAALPFGVREAVRQTDLEPHRRIAERVMQLVPRDEAIWVGPHDSLVYCMSRRAPADHYSFALSWAPSRNEAARLLERFEANPPLLIVDASVGLAKWQPSLESTMPGFDAFLAREYRLIDHVAGRDFHFRKGD
ncbi:MAG: hypothetical protein ACI8TX_000271 [Hyphomicrobiaceae bacterium]|jgi:hypothetical protein